MNAAAEYGKLNLFILEPQSGIEIFYSLFFFFLFAVDKFLNTNV